MDKVKLGTGSKRNTPVSIGIIGSGEVALATESFFSARYQTVLLDPKKTKGRSQWTLAKQKINECEWGVVCVPTPSREDGSCDIDLVEQTVGWLQTPYILLKSTVPVGTTDRLIKESGKTIVFSPLHSGDSLLDSPGFIFGGPKHATRRLIDLYISITGPMKHYRQTTARCAELVKYTENAFCSMKLAFCYEMAAVSESLGIDYYELRDLWLMDSRVSPMHTAVFEHNHEPFTGKQLPADIKALINCASEAGYKPELLEEVIKSNRRIGDMRAKAQAKRKKKSEGGVKRSPRPAPRQLEIDSLLI